MAPVDGVRAVAEVIIDGCWGLDLVERIIGRRWRYVSRTVCLAFMAGSVVINDVTIHELINN